jgi:hypothetical protein
MALPTWRREGLQAIEGSLPLLKATLGQKVKATPRNEHLA